MRGMTDALAIGERVKWYRLRRGLSQEVLAGRIGRTVDWVSKVERGTIPVDRLPVIKSLADALDVSLGDLIAEPSLVDWTADTGPRTVPALRDALMDYRQITSLFAGTSAASRYRSTSSAGMSPTCGTPTRPPASGSSPASYPGSSPTPSSPRASTPGASGHRRSGCSRSPTSPPQWCSPRSANKTSDG
jgi:transcriptional regulator with XRE-family HTH domain